MAYTVPTTVPVRWTSASSNLIATGVVRLRTNADGKQTKNDVNAIRVGNAIECMAEPSPSKRMAASVSTTQQPPMTKIVRSVRPLAEQSAILPPIQFPAEMPARNMPITAVHVASDEPINGESNRPAISCNTKSAAFDRKTIVPISTSRPNGILAKRMARLQFEGKSDQQ